MTAWLLITSLSTLDTMQLLRALVAAMSVAAVVYAALRMTEAEVQSGDRPRNAGSDAPLRRLMQLGSRLTRPAVQTMNLIEVSEEGYHITCNGPEGEHRFVQKSLEREVTCPHCGVTASALDLTQRRVIEQGAKRLGSR